MREIEHALESCLPGRSAAVHNSILSALHEALKDRSAKPSKMEGAG